MEGKVPFHSERWRGVFTPKDLVIMQAAYELSCEKTGWCPATDEDKGLLAKKVIRIYEDGHQDPEDIASLIYRIESLRD